MNRTERGMRRYFVELTAGMVLFMGAMMARHALQAAGTGLATLAAIAPVLGVWVMAGAIVHLFFSLDEFQRQRLLGTIGISAAITALFALTWQLLVDPLHLPSLSLIWCWPIMGGCWFVIAVGQQVRDAKRDGQLGKAFWPYGASQLFGILLFAYAIAGHFLHWPLVFWTFLTGTAWTLGTAGLAIFKGRTCP